jgi:hypothetical protein
MGMFLLGMVVGGTLVIAGWVALTSSDGCSDHMTDRGDDENDYD